MITQKFTFLFCVCLSFGGFAQSGGLQYYSDFNLALEVAEQTDKDVLAYVGHGVSFAEKSLDSLFMDDELSEFISESFVPVRVKDIPTKRFKKGYFIFEYPLLIFYDREGKELYREGNFRWEESKDKILDIAKFALTKPYPTMKMYKEGYDENKMDAYYLSDYLALAKSLNEKNIIEKIHKQYAKIYRNQPQEEWLDFVFENANHEDSKLFEILVNHQRAFEASFGEQLVQTRIVKVLARDLKVFFFNIDLDKFVRKLIDRINKYKVRIKDEYLMSTVAQLKYSRYSRSYKINNDQGEFATKILKSYSEWLDGNTMISALWEVAFYVNDSVQLERGLLHLEEAIRQNNSFWLLDCKSVYLYKLGKRDEASQYVKYAQIAANEVGERYESTIAYMKKTKLLR